MESDRVTTNTSHQTTLYFAMRHDDMARVVNDWRNPNGELQQTILAQYRSGELLTRQDHEPNPDNEIGRHEMQIHGDFNEAPNFEGYLAKSIAENVAYLWTTKHPEDKHLLLGTESA